MLLSPRRLLPPRRLALLIGALVASVLVTVGAGPATAPIEATGPRVLSAPEVAQPVGEQSPEEPGHPLYHSSLSTAQAPAATSASAIRPPSGELAEQIEPLAQAGVGAENLVAVDERAEPVRLRIAAIGVDAEIVPVGVTDTGDYEVPPASQVGWYRFGSAPGEPGSAVLAGHIAWNGEDGVFRSLADLPDGSEIEVIFDDGTVTRATTGETERIDKDELPPSLFEREGEPRIVLITCGGAFNRSLRSYEDNVIATAT